MPAGEEQIAQDAGISVDVDALVERLSAELERSGALVGDGPPDRARRQAIRAEAERLWPVTAERPLESTPGVRGAVSRKVKKTVRKLVRWYVEPAFADQRAFNGAVLKLIDDLDERVQRALDERLLAELDERVTRLERRPTGAPATVAAQPAAAAVPDNFAFESRMRGSTAQIRERQRPYVDDLRDAAPVLDVGCGRGELLALLREAGVEARGVDADADMVAFARGEGLDVEQDDMVAALERAEDGSLGGIFAAQLVEHLPPATLLRMLELAARKLRSGGILIAETINPLSPLALRNYFADLTHAQPLVPETLALLARQAGFREVETRFLNRPAERLDEPDDPALAANVRRLNELLFGPLDYAIVARA
jgi:O-antigen chain-terminating methyltransferase